MITHRLDPGAERMIRAVHARGVPLVQVWGATETSPIAACLHADEALAQGGHDRARRRRCELRIVDVAGNDVACGRSGEILVRGAQRDERLLAATRRPAHGRSPAAGSTRATSATSTPKGFLTIDGRIKDMIISGGENVSPAEVEGVLLDCADIAEAAVVGRPDARWGEIVVAVVAPQPGVTLEPERVLALFDGRLARFKHPKQVVVVDTLPRTALGKVRKDELRQLVARRRRSRPRGANRMSLKIGIDVGGTFTDFVVARDGEPPRIHKTLSTPADPSIAVVRGWPRSPRPSSRRWRWSDFVRSIDTIVHGTTVTTNATLTGSGARCALLTTEGVRDALEMRRGVREEQYNNR